MNDEPAFPGPLPLECSQTQGAGRVENLAMAQRWPEVAFNAEQVRAWLASLPALAAQVGGAPQDWQIGGPDTGDASPAWQVRDPDTGQGVRVTQAQPLQRGWFEQQHQRIAGPHLAGLIPAQLHYDANLHLSVTELFTPQAALRRELVAGRSYAQVPVAVAEYIARSAVLTSALALPLETVLEHTAVFSHAPTRLAIEQIFADPFEDLSRNRWTTPELDDTANNVRQDADIRAAVASAGEKFLSRKEALLHGDLHTGSVRVAGSDTRVVDAASAQYGPVGFDVGVFIAHLLIAFFAQSGQHTEADPRQDHAQIILKQINQFWSHFALRHDTLWQQNAQGDAWPRRLFIQPAHVAAFARARQLRLQNIYEDALAFAGAEIIRRILGHAHSLDFEAISNPERRADAERRALALARNLLLAPHRLSYIEAVTQRAQQLAVRTMVEFAN